MATNSLRINPSSSPRGSVEPPSPGETKAANRTIKSSHVATTNTSKYIHVHRFKNTNLYGAWFNDPSIARKKKRLYFGCHLTAYLAARAQDRAALKYKPSALDPSSIELNFSKEDYAEDEMLRKVLTNDEFGELLRKESRPKYTKMEPTPCLRKFLEEEEKKGNIPVESPTDSKEILSLKNYLQDVLRKRKMGPGLLPVSSVGSGDDDGSGYEQGEESEDEDEVVVDRNEVASANVVRGTEPNMAGIALSAAPACPVQTEITGQSPRPRSGSKLTRPIPSRIVQDESSALKWGGKRRRSRVTRPSIPPPVVERRPVTTTNLHLHKGRSNETTPRNPAPVVDRRPTDTTNLHLLASVALSISFEDL